MTRHRARLLAVASLVSAISLLLPLMASAAGPSVSREARPAVSGSGTHEGALMVGVRAGVARTDVDAALVAAGAVAVGRLDQIGTVVVTPAAGRERGAVIRALAASAVVRYVEADVTARVTVEPDDTLWYEQWGPRKIRAPRAWNYTTGDDGPVIAILDSGIKRDHVDLTDRIVDGYDFVNSDAIANDDNGHGTMVAGVAAGRGNNGVGIAGNCWGCRIMPVKVVTSGGDVKFSNAAAGIIWATDNGARIINMSFGKSTGSDTLAAAVAYAVDHGVIVVASAGNEGNKAKFYPAAYPGVISVAATTNSDTLYSWSTRGLWVKLAAPGCSWTTKRGGGWGSFCGTSASAPAVAGVAGLAIALKPDASRAQVQDSLLDTAVYFSAAMGGGRVDAYAAVRKFADKPGNN